MSFFYSPFFFPDAIYPERKSVVCADGIEMSRQGIYYKEIVQCVICAGSILLHGGTLLTI